MSVDVSARLCYGYMFPSDKIDMSYLDEKAWLVCDVIEDFDAYDSFFRTNAYDSKSDIFIGVTLASEWCDYQVIDPVEIFEADKCDKILHSIIELFNVNPADAKDSKPQFYLTKVWC